MSPLSFRASEIPASLSSGPFIAVSGAGLNAAVELVDRAHMLASETELLRENPSWLAVLQAYVAVLEDLANADAQPEAAADMDGTGGESPPESDVSDDTADIETAENDSDSDSGEAQAPQKTRRSQPWVPRLTSVEGVESEELSKIHGRLIAYGLLKCDLADRSAGVVYQLTTEARRALASLEDADSDEDSLADEAQEISRSA